MESEQELWEKALVKAGVWKPDTCTYCNDARAYTQEFSGTIGIHTEHAAFAPAIGDAEATVKLLEWLGHNDPMSLGFKIHYWPERDEQLPWNVTFSGQASNEGRTLPLALAAAVLGVPDGK